MNSNKYIDSLGVTVAQARSFIADNLNKPAAIFNAAKQYKIDSQMLAEIVPPVFGHGQASTKNPGPLRPGVFQSLH